MTVPPTPRQSDLSPKLTNWDCSTPAHVEARAYRHAALRFRSRTSISSGNPSARDRSRFPRRALVRGAIEGDTFPPAITKRLRTAMASGAAARVPHQGLPGDFGIV